MKSQKIFVLFVLLVSNINAQSHKIIWDLEDNKPISYATIRSKNNYLISNKNGEFNIKNLTDTIKIQRLGYYDKKVNLNLLKSDTIFMKPFIFQLEEVVVEKNRFKKMVGTISTHYALEPHQEHFFLRALLKKNGKYYKIIDFEGVLEKKSLFRISSRPKIKKNYIVEIKNMRKVGIENKNIDFEMFSFNTLLDRISSVYLSPKKYNFSTEINENNNFSKLKAVPKDTNKIKTRGYYLINNLDNSFNEVYVCDVNNDVPYAEKRNVKYRTIKYELKSNFKKSDITNKYQLSKAILNSKVETLYKDIKDVFEIKYIYYSYPVKNIKVKKNINLKKDIFYLNKKYNSEFWRNNENLKLTEEMQKFVNKVNSSKGSSDFKTKTNMR